jgi:prepilin peptidase CpaA
MDIQVVVAAVCVFVFTAIAMVCDVKTRKLPNALTVPAFALGLLFQIVAGLGAESGPVSGVLSGIVFALEGFALGFGLLMLLWFVGGSGGGDVKFMGALGTWLGAWVTFQVLVVSAMLSAVITVVILGKKTFQLRHLGQEETDAPKQQSYKKSKKKTSSKWSQPLRSRESWIVPFGVPAALATWIVVGLQCSGYVLPWPIPMR